MPWADCQLLFKGLLITLAISGFSLVLGILLGLALALLRYLAGRAFSVGVTIYVEGIRSVPLILWVIAVHYALYPALGITPPIYLSGITALSVFSSAYLAEIFTGGMEAIRRHEWEAAKSLGLSRWQRLTTVVIPLVFLRTLPALISQLISLIKDSSLISVIGLMDLTRSAELIYERTGEELSILMLVAVVYFAVCYALSLWGQRLEQPFVSNPNKIV